MEYKNVEAFHIDELMRKINGHAKNGWFLHTIQGGQRAIMQKHEPKPDYSHYSTPEPHLAGRYDDSYDGVPREQSR